MTGENYIIFDCYQTLIYKKYINRTARQFFNREFNNKIPSNLITRSLGIMYERHKFTHPKFTSAENREKYYITYNKEFAATMGLKLSDQQARKLNQTLDASTIYALYGDVPIILTYLAKKKTPLGIISNWTKSVEKILESLHIKDNFNFLCSSSELKYAKPDPRIFNCIPPRIKRGYKKIYYVGDDYELDVMPACQAGLIPILLDRNKIYPAKIDCLKITSLIDLKHIV